MRLALSTLKVAVVGHLEWVQFAYLSQLPRAGEIAHAHDAFEEPAGGGAVAAVQMARLTGDATFFTALGDDELGCRSRARLEELGVKVHGAIRAKPTRRAVTFIDERKERTITTLGERLEPLLSDTGLPWEELSKMDAVFFTAGDEGALRASRSARVLLASPRAKHALRHGIQLDALVLSKDDADERKDAAVAFPDARLEVLTDGGCGGTYREKDGHTDSWEPAPAPAVAVDSYGCGDSFAAGLTCGLAAGFEISRALELAARCGAACLGGHGPYESQLAGDSEASADPPALA
jgi:ribokinase